MLKAELNNKGIQWGLSNPNPLGMEVFRRSEMFACMNTVSTAVIYIQNMERVSTQIHKGLLQSLICC